jgi:MraZ protein
MAKKNKGPERLRFSAERWPSRLGEAIVALFLSTFEKAIDKKGRVSVPAPFRAALAGQNFNGIIAYGSFVNPCIEACGMDRIETLHEQIESLDPFSQERDAFATAILGGSVQMGFDGEGRVVLPESLIADADINGKCVFVGKGKTFEIWEPKAFETYEEASRKLAKEKRLALRTIAKGGA